MGTESSETNWEADDQPDSNAGQYGNTSLSVMLRGKNRRVLKSSVSFRGLSVPVTEMGPFKTKEVMVDKSYHQRV